MHVKIILKKCVWIIISFEIISTYEWWFILSMPKAAINFGFWNSELPEIKKDFETNNLNNFDGRIYYTSRFIRRFADKKTILNHAVDNLYNFWKAFYQKMIFLNKNFCDFFLCQSGYGKPQKGVLFLVARPLRGWG